VYVRCRVGHLVPAPWLIEHSEVEKRKAPTIWFTALPESFRLLIRCAVYSRICAGVRRSGGCWK
jgi:hypothetical protein